MQRLEVNTRKRFVHLQERADSRGSDGQLSAFSLLGSVNVRGYRTRKYSEQKLRSQMIRR
jgi:hypothetical protein